MVHVVTLDAADQVTGTALTLPAYDFQDLVSFFKGAVAMFAKHPRIRRYAWYPWATNNGLVNTDGSLTDLGKAFAALPATRRRVSNTGTATSS